MKYKLCILIVGMFASFGLLLGPLLASVTFADGVGFQQNDLIDDSVFSDTTTLNAAQIDNFLNGFSGSCISSNSGFQAPDLTGYSPSGGYTYGANVTAGTVIYHAAQAYDINPEVILSTLQKEQSLVTGSSGICSNPLRYAAAAGYGCPDGGSDYSYSGINLYTRNGQTVTSVSGTCVNTAAKAGFSQQVIRAAWLLKFGQERSEGNTAWAEIHGSWNNSDDLSTCYSGPMTQGTYKRCPSGTATYYDGYTTIDGVSVHMDTGATAALYWYTPHFAGNQNFDTIFESWFGSVIGSDLVRTADNATVYLVSGSSKYPISDGSLLNDYSPLGSVKYVSDAYLAAYTTGATLGHMVGGADGTLYFVDAGIKLPFSSCTSVANYGYNCANVITLTDFQLNKLVTGPAVTALYATTSGKLFYIASGQKHEVFDQQSLSQAGINQAQNTLLEAGLAYLPYGTPVIRDDVVATDRSTGQKTFYEGGTFYALIGDETSLPAFSSLPQSKLDDQSVTSMPQSTSLNGFVKNSAGTASYVLLSSGKALLSNPANWASSYVALSDTFLNSVPTISSSINNQLVMSPTNGTVYFVANGKKLSIPSWGDLLAQHINPLAITTITNNEISQLPNGPNLYGPGSLVKTADSGTVYMVLNPSNLAPLSNYLFPQELGLSTSTRTIPTSDFQSYTVSAQLKSMVQCGGTYYVGDDGQSYTLNSSQLALYGFSTGAFVDGGSICSNLPIASQSLSTFVRVANGTIYLIQNGQKDPITSYQVYLAHGGTAANTVFGSDYFASLIATGPSISQ